MGKRRAYEAVALVKLNGVLVPKHLVPEVEALVAQSYIGKKGWKTRATNRALWLLGQAEE
jgi:hypothetical protein